MPKFTVITFDCYGTLIDWESGISEGLLGAARKAGVQLDRATVLALHEKVEPAIQAERYRPYREVLELVAERIANEIGWQLDRDARTVLWKTLPHWRPFPDTNRALKALASDGYRLGILSNIDDALLAGTLEHFPVKFDVVVTAQQVRSYKPGRAHFVEARKRIGEVAWLHAARSYFHDVEPASSLGIPVVWVNRGKDNAPGPARPTAEVSDLAGLVDWLSRHT